MKLKLRLPNAGLADTCMISGDARRKQDGPHLPGPLLPRREERENSPALSSGSKLSLHRSFVTPLYHHSVSAFLCLFVIAMTGFSADSTHALLPKPGLYKS